MGGSTIPVTVLFFASARELAGTSEMTLEVDDSTDTTSLRQILADKFPKLAQMVLDEQNLTLAVNEEYIVPGQPVVLHKMDTIALIPPISGG